MPQIKISPQGDLSFIYDDELYASLKKHGSARIERASHVEPNSEGKWEATMSETVLGPFSRRQDALRAEIRYLERTVLS